MVFQHEFRLQAETLVYLALWKEFQVQILQNFRYNSVCGLKTIFICSFLKSFTICVTYLLSPPKGQMLMSFCIKNSEYDSSSELGSCIIYTFTLWHVKRQFEDCITFNMFTCCLLENFWSTFIYTSNFYFLDISRLNYFCSISIEFYLGK